MNVYSERMVRLQKLLVEKRIDLAILNLNCDLYYYTGTIQPLYLLVPAQGGAIAVARKALERIGQDSPGLIVEVFNNTRDLSGIIQRHNFQKAAKLGFSLENTAYATVNRWRQLFGETEIVNLSEDLHLLRMIKNESEIGIYREAGQIMSEIPEVVKENFRPGMTELELSAIIEKYMRVNGSAGLTRCRAEEVEMIYGVCSAGTNAIAGTKFNGVCGGTGLSAAVPYGAGWKEIKPGEPVVLDYAFNYQGYHIDQTRLFCWGRPSQEISHAFQAMLQIQDLVFAELGPDAFWTTPYEKALQLAEKLGYGEAFMGIGSEKVRFVGHGVGLELDEPPYLAPKMNYPLSLGMTIAVEPKVVLPGIGVIGNEDTVLITENGFERLTTASREMIVV